MARCPHRSPPVPIIGVNGPSFGSSSCSSFCCCSSCSNSRCSFPIVVLAPVLSLIPVALLVVFVVVGDHDHISCCFVLRRSRQAGAILALDGRVSGLPCLGQSKPESTKQKPRGPGFLFLSAGASQPGGIREFCKRAQSGERNFCSDGKVPGFRQRALKEPATNCDVGRAPAKARPARSRVSDSRRIGVKGAPIPAGRPL